MWAHITSTIKNIALFTLLIGGLSLLGASLTNYFNFSLLISFFSIIINLVMIFDFFINVPLLLQLVGWALLVKSFIWTWNAVYAVVLFFKTKT